MPLVKMCKNCNRLLSLDTEVCPDCGHVEFELVELSPFEGDRDAVSSVS